MSNLYNILKSIIENMNTLVRSVNGVKPKKNGNVDLPQPDWNQSTAEASDYIKNRTHWTERVKGQLIEKSNFTISSDQDFPLAFFPNNVAKICEGATCTVNFDGKVYTVKTVNMEESIVFGNFGLLGAGENTGEPFLGMFETSDSSGIVVDDSGLYGIVCILAEPDTEHTISFEIETDVVHKLGSKYVEHPVVFKPSGDGSQPFEIPIFSDDLNCSGDHNDIKWHFDGDSKQYSLVIPRLSELSDNCSILEGGGLYFSANFIIHSNSNSTVFKQEGQQDAFEKYNSYRRYGYVDVIPDDEGTKYRVRCVPLSDNMKQGFLAYKTSKTNGYRLLCVNAYADRVEFVHLI